MLSDAWGWRLAHPDGYADGATAAAVRVGQNGGVPEAAAAEAAAAEAVAEPGEPTEQADSGRAAASATVGQRPEQLPAN
jgi:hypothetical protein